MDAVHTSRSDTHRRVKEDMSSKMPVGRVEMALSEITLNIIGFTRKERKRAPEGNMQSLEIHRTQYD